MKTIKQFFQNLSISGRQLLVIFLAGMMILVTTACGRTDAATPYTSNSTTNPATDGKVEHLIRQADRNNQKVRNTQDYLNEVTPDKPLTEQAKDLGKSAKRTADNLGKSAQNAVKNTPDKTQKGLRNLKENIGEAIDQANDAAQYTTKP